MDKVDRDIMALALTKGLGARSIVKILRDVDDTEEVFTMPARRLAELTGGRFSDTAAVKAARDSRKLAEELEYIEKEGITLLCYGTRGYPEVLMDIYDPPAVLFCKGKLQGDEANAVAIVGSRRCSLYGLQMAEQLAFALAVKGVTVISGMARGIDSAAHRGALRAGGRTVAVMGSGFGHVYPPGSGKLFSAICESGAVLTEYTSDTFPERGNFPRRNRIISGMAKGVVVVEATRKSGAMITVDLALDQGREVFAVPGRADSLTSGGTNELIQNGAKLVMSADDILEDLDPGRRFQVSGLRGKGETEENRREHRRKIGKNGLKVLDALEKGPAHIDLISELTNIDLSELAEELLRMEIKGFVKAEAGSRYSIRDTQNSIL